ncbi:MAG: hypothetical protein VKJ04_04710 [Vampirovibrionales bacterium]|nr:hypothetical protein [Vampirovibrionales bacterium]
MDAFQIIQHFFSRMHCQHCEAGFSHEDIELLRKEESVYVVNVFCHKCDTQNGVALVGLESNIGPEDLDELDLEAAEFDAEFDAAFSSGLGIDDKIFEDKTGGSLSSRGKNAIPEEILMQLLEQVGALPPELQKLQKKQQPKNKRKRFKDPELTRQERLRLAQYAPINENDVLDAHHFFQGLDANWMQHIPNEFKQLNPEETRQSQTAPHIESQAD